jgi:hypothetical protein
VILLLCRVGVAVDFARTNFIQVDGDLVGLVLIWKTEKYDVF